MDVLAVPNVCGADIMRTSNFSLKPIKVSVFTATEAEIESVPKVPALASQRTPKDFRNSTIRVERELRRDSSYVPEFANVPLVVEDLEVKLSLEEMALLQAVKLDIYGDDDASALRDILFSWWEDRFLSAKSGAPDVTTSPND